MVKAIFIHWRRDVWWRKSVPSVSQFLRKHFSPKYPLKTFISPARPTHYTHIFICMGLIVSPPTDASNETRRSLAAATKAWPSLFWAAPWNALASSPITAANYEAP